MNLNLITCRLFIKNRCREGDRCPFPHIMEAGREIDNICRYHFTGECYFKELCKYEHVELSELKGNSVEADVSQGSERKLNENIDKCEKNQQAAKIIKKRNIFIPTRLSPIPEVPMINESLCKTGDLELRTESEQKIQLQANIGQNQVPPSQLNLCKFGVANQSPTQSATTLQALQERRVTYVKPFNNVSAPAPEIANPPSMQSPAIGTQIFYNSSLNTNNVETIRPFTQTAFTDQVLGRPRPTYFHPFYNANAAITGISNPPRMQCPANVRQNAMRNSSLTTDSVKTVWPLHKTAFADQVQPIRPYLPPSPFNNANSPITGITHPQSMQCQAIVTQNAMPNISLDTDSVETYRPTVAHPTPWIQSKAVTRPYASGYSTMFWHNVETDRLPITHQPQLMQSEAAGRPNETVNSTLYGHNVVRSTVAHPEPLMQSKVVEGRNAIVNCTLLEHNVETVHPTVAHPAPLMQSEAVGRPNTVVNSTFFGSNVETVRTTAVHPVPLMQSKDIDTTVNNTLFWDNLEYDYERPLGH